MTDEPDPRKIIPIEDLREEARQRQLEDFDSDLFDDGSEDDEVVFGEAQAPPPGLWERVGDVHPGFTYGLVLLILVAFAAELVTATAHRGELIAGGSLVGPMIDHGAAVWTRLLAGEWWRVLAPIFLHANALHVGSNLLALAVVGGVAERAYGHARFLVLFVLAGAAGSAASSAHQAQLMAAATAVASASPGDVALNAAARIPGSIGASGAVFGVGAAVIAAAFRMHGLLPAWRVRALIGATLPLLLSSLAAGFARPGTDNAAHLGGAMAGLILGLALPFHPQLSGRAETPSARFLWASFGLVLFGFLIASAVAAFWIAPASGGNA